MVWSWGRRPDSTLSIVQLDAFTASDSRRRIASSKNSGRASRVSRYAQRELIELNKSSGNLSWISLKPFGGDKGVGRSILDEFHGIEPFGDARLRLGRTRDSLASGRHLEVG